MIFIFEGELNSENIEDASLLYYNIFMVKNGNKNRSTLPEEQLYLFVGKTCNCDFIESRQDEQGRFYIILTPKDKEGLAELHNIVTPDGFLAMSVVI